jgi:hypothetical protein
MSNVYSDPYAPVPQTQPYVDSFDDPNQRMYEDMMRAIREQEERAKQSESGGGGGGGGGSIMSMFGGGGGGGGATGGFSGG